MHAPAAELSLATVMHTRRFPVSYRFRYPVFSMLIDVDRLDEVARTSRLFSWNRFNLVSFFDRDHGPRDGSALRPWAEKVLAGAGVTLAGGRVRLLCLPRLLNYQFNPLSLWYCEHADGTPRAVIAQVHNTFGEQHCYVLHNRGQALAWPVRQSFPKRFHVSPFISMAARYQFRVGEPRRRIAVAIREFEEGQLLLVAAQAGDLRPFSTPGLARALARTPLMTFKVILMIHWRALRIWLAGAPVFRKPPLPEKEVTS